MGSVNRLAFFFSLLPACYMAAAKVAVNRRNVYLLFDDVEANFAPKAKGSEELGILYLAEPLDACRVLTNKAEQISNVSAPFALIVRGGCSFEEKVTRAQKAGFKAAIIYDNEDDGVLVAMAGNSAVINIPAVFVTKAAGELLKKYAGLTSVEIWIIPNFEFSAWSIMLISFMFLLAMSGGVGTCFLFFRRHVRGRLRTSSICEFHGMSSHLVNAMPSLIFTAVLEDNCTSRTCAICLEDYSIGEKLRILPCRHKFHAACVDTWLTSWRTFCPVCKRDAKTGLPHPPPSESTPLLTVATSILSSVRSTLASSSAMRIVRSTYHSSSVLRNHSLPGTPLVQSSFLSYHQSPSLAISQRSLASHLSSPHSRDCPSFSSVNSTAHIPSVTNVSASFIGSFNHHQQHPLNHSEFAMIFTPVASAQSPPECETV